jgi:hypothetical protein
MVRLRGSPPGRWRGSGDDRWVRIENFGRHWHRAKGKVVDRLGYSEFGHATQGRVADTRICEDRLGAGRGCRYSLESSQGWATGWAGPLSFYPFESTLNGQHEDHALFYFSNILEFITCHLIRHKSAEMPPKVPVRFFLFDGDLVF